jgi:hypothetical protein
VRSARCWEKAGTASGRRRTREMTNKHGKLADG